MKKVFAYILDLFFFICFTYVYKLIFISFFTIISAITNTDFRQMVSQNRTTLDLIEITDFSLKVFVIYTYYITIPRRRGNTISGSILKIKDNLGFRSPMEYFKELFTTWVCPTCGRRYKDEEVKVCDNCNPKKEMINPK